MKAVACNELPLAEASFLENGEAADCAVAPNESAGTDRHFPKRFLAAVAFTAGAFGWTCWGLIHSAQMESALSTMIGAALLLLCLVAWAAVIRSLFSCRQTFLESAKAVEVNERLAQERDLLRSIIDGLPDRIYAKDRRGRFVLNNPAHAKSRGVTSPEEMKGRSDSDYFPPNLARQFFTDEQKIIETGEPVINQEQCSSAYLDPSSKKRWSLSSKVLWRDHDGNILGTVGLTRDIHDFKMTQEALRKSEEKLRLFTTELERSNRELQDFAYVASHDLQEPLRKIVVFGDRLKDQNSAALGTDGLDYLDRMQKAASRMQTLINDLLTFSRVTTKAQPFGPVDLAEIAREVVVDLEGRIEQVKGRVELGALPVIDSERLQMRQLLQNLIGNALKFRRPEEAPVVKVEAQIISAIAPQAAPGSPAQQLCQLTVSDNGIGFDEKYLDRIFNVFQRLHKRSEYEGTGMGLAIARKIALYHHGCITAKSKPGEGATFIVTLPAAHPKKEETQTEGANHEN